MRRSRRGTVDELNLFVYGCSGGGILTSYIVGNTDRFAAASANSPIVNWLSAMGSPTRSPTRGTFEKPFWEDASEWMDRSSIFYVGNVTTPTMLMIGENDLRTPMGQTEEFYQALQYEGVSTVMVRFKDSGTVRRRSRRTSCAPSSTCASGSRNGVPTAHRLTPRTSNHRDRTLAACCGSSVRVGT